MANRGDSANLFAQGRVVKATDADFEEGLRAAVDYRGDVALSLVDGAGLEGYIFSASADRLELFPKNSPRAISIQIGEIESLTFSGEDTANGKSFEDWLSKKEAERSALKAQPIEA
jgi:hypothetical protein